MANRRSIPLIIASSMEGFRDGSEKIPHLPRGVPGSDLGQHLQLRLQGQTADINAGSGFYTSNATTPHTMITPLQGDPSHYGSDQTLSDDIFGFPTSSGPPSDRPIDTTGFGTSSSSPSADPHSLGQYSAVPNSTTNGGPPDVNTVIDQTFWDLINGNGSGDGRADLDFSTFLQNLNDAT